MLFRWLLVVVIAGMAGCGDQSPADTQGSPPQSSSPPRASYPPRASHPPRASYPPQALTARQMQQWAASCALCHAAGEAGAPVVGNAEHWQPRLDQGRDVLLAHTLEGFNSMPPLGYCMSCATEDFVAMIDFMLEGTQ